MNYLSEFKQFPRLPEESFHFYEWESVYQTKAKFELMDELISQEQKNYPWKDGSVVERHRLAALFTELQEREEVGLLTRLRRRFKSTFVSSLVSVFDRLS